MAQLGGPWGWWGGLFAIWRMDAWVFRVGIAIPVVCLVGIGLWHLLGSLASQIPRKPRAVRLSPEPPDRSGPAGHPVGPAAGSPEAWLEVCSEREAALAQAYLELAESWWGRGQSQKAGAAWRKVLQVAPTGPAARRAQERLRQTRSVFDEPFDHS